MVETFEADSHFRTYNKERDPSFTANCNVLAALLCQPDPDQFASQVLKAVKFLCDHWWSSDGKIDDKWVRITSLTRMLARSPNSSCTLTCTVRI